MPADWPSRSVIPTAVIGFGLSARTFHLPFLQASPAFELVGLSTSQQAAAQDYARVSGQSPRLYASATELIAETSAALVIITAPNAAHYPLAQAALQRGLHVVLEKPFVNTVAQGQALLALAQQHKRLLSVYHNRRWDGDFLTLQALVKQGTLGQIHALSSHFDRFRPLPQARWREMPGPGAGVWYDLGSHLLDQALCLFGWPQAVSARCLSLRQSAAGQSLTDQHTGVCDYFHVQLHYPGCEVLLHASPFAAGENLLRFELQGSLGSYRKSGLDPQEARLKQGVKPGAPGWSDEIPEAFGTLSDAQGSRPLPTLPGDYGAYFAALAAALQGTGPVPVPAAEALRVIQLLTLAERSSACAQTLKLEPEL